MEVRDRGISERSLKMHYWDDGEWKQASYIQIHPPSDTIERAVPVLKLTETSILIDGKRLPRPVPLISIIGGVLAAIEIGIGIMAYVRRK